MLSSVYVFVIPFGNGAPLRSRPWLGPVWPRISYSVVIMRAIVSGLGTLDTYPH